MLPRDRLFAMVVNIPTLPYKIVWYGFMTDVHSLSDGYLCTSKHSRLHIVIKNLSGYQMLHTF